MCVYIDINSHIYIHSVYKHSYCVAYVILYIHSIILLYMCLLCDFFLENATTNAHGLCTELPDKLKDNHSIIWWTIQSAIMVGSSSNVTTRAVSQAYVCLFQHQKVPTHQCSPTWSSMCQVMTIPQDQQPWVYTHPLSSAGIPSPPSHCHRPKFDMACRSQCLWD